MNMINDLFAMLADAVNINKEQIMVGLAFVSLAMAVLIGIAGLFSLKEFLIPNEDRKSSGPGGKNPHRIGALGYGVLLVVFAFGLLWLADVLWLGSKQ